MKNIVPVGGLLPLDTLTVGHAIAAMLLTTPREQGSALPYWPLGDDATAMLTQCRELDFDLSVLRREPTRDDLRRRASDRLRRMSQRYRRDAACGGVEIGTIDDQALRNPDAHGRDETALAA